MDRRKILVVDSDKVAAVDVCGCLEKFGYEALEAQDGETAWQIMRREKPDLVVLELALPDQDGFEFIRAIRADSSLFRLPIIILSVRASEADKQSGLDVGADDYLTKPFNPRELAARVHAVLRRTYRQNARAKTQPSTRQKGA